jgi:hypothetical protein
MGNGEVCLRALAHASVHFAIPPFLAAPSHPCSYHLPSEHIPHLQTFYGKREYMPSGNIEGDYRGYGLTDMRRIRKVVSYVEKTIMTNYSHARSTHARARTHLHKHACSLPLTLSHSHSITTYTPLSRTPTRTHARTYACSHATTHMFRLKRNTVRITGLSRRRRRGKKKGNRCFCMYIPTSCT